MPARTTPSNWLVNIRLTLIDSFLFSESRAGTEIGTTNVLLLEITLYSEEALVFLAFVGSQIHCSLQH